jgi:hypothetical protein
LSDRERKPVLFRVYWPVVWLAGALVPYDQRPEWRRRKRLEVWHWAAFLQDPERGFLSSRQELARFAWQCWPEALWRRYERESTVHVVERWMRSPRTCLLGCAVLLLVVIGGSGLLPITRSMMLPLPIPDVTRVGTVEYAGGWWSELRSGVLDSWVKLWGRSTAVAGAAEFSFDRHTLTVVGRQQRIVAAQVSPSFFDVLGARAVAGRLPQANDKDQCAQCVVVSYDFWKTVLHRDSSRLGKPVQFDGAQATLVGVLPERFWFVAREVSAWEVQPPVVLAPPPPPPPGLEILVRDDKGTNYAVSPVAPERVRLVTAVVRLKPKAGIAQGETAMLDAIRPVLWPHRPGRVVISPLDEQRHAMLYPYGVALLAALLITAVAASSRLRQPLRQFNQRRTALRWWAFFGLKSALLLIASGLLSIELAPLFSKSLARGMDPSAWPISVWLCLVICVGALMWAVYDQRYRCPVCLSRLTLPVMVGEHGRLLLGSGATEFVCGNGHSMVEISDFATSWIDPEHWTHLDDSWKTLFGPEEKRD